MPNTSATGGYVIPGVLPDPLEDDALDDFMGDVVGAITGLDRNTLVRPRWQAEPPNLPAFGTNWVAVGVPERTRDTYPVIQHDPAAAAGEGADILIRHEQLKLLCSFYGPNCQANAGFLADGLMIAQNREAMGLAGFALREVGEPTKAPDMIKNKWTPRCDLAVWISREIRREYPILNLISAQATLNSVVITDAITATDPAP
jgi:hypothetical protein